MAFVAEPCPRWNARNDHATRRWLTEREGIPLPGLVAEINRPIVARFAKKVGADDDGLRAMLRTLPGKLDRVDELIADGVIGGPERNAADFQILTTVRSLLSMDNLRRFAWLQPAPAES